MKIITELKNHFCADGVHRSKLIKLKKLRKRYPNSLLLEAAISVMWKKVWLFPGADFLGKFRDDLFAKKINENGFLTINGITFNLSASGSKWIFPLEYPDLFSTDDHFRNDYSSEPLFDEIMSIMFEIEGPYQRGNVTLNKGDVIIDAGSNMGMFALFAAKHNKCKIYAFEPNPTMIALLNENIANNNLDEKITVVPLGLSNVACDLDFKLSSQNIGASTIFTDTTGTNVEWEEDTITIRCVSLDEWVKENQIPKIDFIKADIEGAERLLLRGATEVLKTMQPKISICTYHLADDPQVLEKIILDANPNYIVEQGEKKLYAYVR